MKFTIQLLFVVAVLIAASSSAQAQEKKESGTQQAFGKFAQLAGEWEGTGSGDGSEFKARILYKVTSGGSAVVETIDPDGDHEMVTVIHPDGDALLLTHYCMIGNQPHMKAKPEPGADKVSFEFVRATNLKSEKDMHMRSVIFTFVDKDTLKTEWTTFQDGKEAGKAIFNLKRKK